jgi:hypothetical protein
MSRELSPVKKIAFSAVIVLLLAVIVELLASVAGAMVTGRRFSSARLQGQRDALVANAGRVAVNPRAQWLQDEILHPYVGYTPVPRGAGTSAGVAGPVAAAPPTRAADRVTIAFVGGSFAVAFAEHGAPRLIARLSELPAFARVDVEPLVVVVTSVISATRSWQNGSSRLSAAISSSARPRHRDKLSSVDALDFFLVRYEQVHRVLSDPAIAKLTESQMRGRPQAGVNTVMWLLWHMARVEDVGVNRFVVDEAQVLDDGWLERLGVERRDVGTGMNDLEVDELSAHIDLEGLRGYWDAVTRRTPQVVQSLRGSDLETLVPAARVKHVAVAEGAVAPGAEWLTEFWAGKRTRAWILAQTPLLHVYGHYFEARVGAGLWGARSL